MVEETVVHILWINCGLSCNPDSVALTAATQPSIEEIALGGKEAQAALAAFCERVRGRARPVVPGAQAGIAATAGLPIPEVVDA